jgi:hypothetical protein
MGIQEPFVHRHNDDGTWDSICTKCFRTTAQRHTETELQTSEDFHDCVAMEAGIGGNPFFMPLGDTNTGN